MLLVVDANVLVSELLRVRGRDLIRKSTIELRISEETLEEANHEMGKRAAKIVEQGRASRASADKMLDEARMLLEEQIAPIPHETYSGYENQALYRIPRDPDDAPTVALALALGGGEGRCGIWTNDGDFLGCGIPTWTAETLSAHLRYQNERVGR